MEREKLSHPYSCYITALPGYLARRIKQRGLTSKDISAPRLIHAPEGAPPTKSGMGLGSRLIIRSIDGELIARQFAGQFDGSMCPLPRARRVKKSR